MCWMQQEKSRGRNSFAFLFGRDYGDGRVDFVLVEMYLFVEETFFGEEFSIVVSFNVAFRLRLPFLLSEFGMQNMPICLLSPPNQ